MCWCTRSLIDIACLIASRSAGDLLKRILAPLVFSVLLNLEKRSLSQMCLRSNLKMSPLSKRPLVLSIAELTLSIARCEKFFSFEPPIASYFRLYLHKTFSDVDHHTAVSFCPET